MTPGLDIHEMGGCRMGNNIKDSMLNKWNQLIYVKCIRYGRSLYDQYGQSKSFDIIHGIDSKSGKSCSGRIE